VTDRTSGLARIWYENGEFEKMDVQTEEWRYQEVVRNSTVKQWEATSNANVKALEDPTRRLWSEFIEKVRVLADNARLERELDESRIKTEQLESALKNITENRDNRNEIEIRMIEIERMEEERVIEMKKLEKWQWRLLQEKKRGSIMGNKWSNKATN